MKYQLVDANVLGQRQSEKALEILELNQYIHTMTAAAVAETLSAFQRYLEYGPDETVVATLVTCNGLEILCQGHMGERYVLYARIINGELIIENERYESVFDYAEEMELSEEDINYIKFGKREKSLEEMVASAKQLGEKQFADNDYDSEIGFENETTGQWVINPWMDTTGRFVLNDSQAVEEHGLANVLKFIYQTNK